MAESWLTNYLLAFLNLNEALWIGLFEPLPNLYEQMVDGSAPFIYNGFPRIGFGLMFLRQFVS